MQRTFPVQQTPPTPHHHHHYPPFSTVSHYHPPSPFLPLNPHYSHHSTNAFKKSCARVAVERHSQVLDGMLAFADRLLGQAQVEVRTLER